MHRQSDTELLELWAAGNRAAGATLLHRHSETVHKFFRRSVRGAIDDLVQQTFLGCIEARDRFRGDASFKTFLLAIARHKLIMHYRSRKEQTSGAPLSDLASPIEATATREDESALTDAIRGLPPDLQDVLRLAYWAGLDGPEIAAKLEMPLNTVYSRISRAKRVLRQKLAGRRSSRAPADFS